MFKITRSTPEDDPHKEVTKTILTELDHHVIAKEYSQASELVAMYDTLTKNDKSAEKRGMSDSVVVAIISAVASLGGILAIVKHEEMSVFTSKAVGFIVKPKF